MTLTAGINAPPVDNIVTGEVFAFSATGGYAMAAGFATIATLEQTTVSKFDVTNALQVTIAASVLNLKLGITAETNSYDATTQTFGETATAVADGTFVVSTASISLSAAEFQTALVAKENIVSVGAYASMYANFKTYVTTYFGIPGGFASLFNQATLFTLTGTDQENLYDLLKPAAPNATVETPTGDEVAVNYVNDLTGSITISDITKLLRYAVDFNAFGNRTPGIPDSASPNIGVGDGFLAGDLIYVAAGTQITLDLDISPELQLDPFNNLNLTEGSVFGTGGSTVAGLTTAGSDGFAALPSALAATVVAGSYSNVSTVTRTNIKRVLNAPLLIRLT
jgi:hypothetical protein